MILRTCRRIVKFSGAVQGSQEVFAVLQSDGCCDKLIVSGSDSCLSSVPTLGVSLARRRDRPMGGPPGRLLPAGRAGRDDRGRRGARGATAGRGREQGGGAPGGASDGPAGDPRAV